MTVEELATELGIDLATAKPEAVTKVRAFITDADTKFRSATELSTAAEANLRKVQEEQDAINRHIEEFGTSASTEAALRANLAAMEAQLKSLKEQGINVNIPEPVAARQQQQNGGKPTFDPDKFRGSVSSVITQSFNVNNKHMALFGRPLPDDIDSLATEAQKAGKSLADYAAQKYDFAGEEKRRADASQAAHDAAVAEKAVKEYREKNPNVTGNPFMSGGSDSNHPQILKPRDPKDMRAFANLSPREKIAQSVARSRELAAAN